MLDKILISNIKKADKHNAHLQEINRRKFLFNETIRELNKVHGRGGVGELEKMFEFRLDEKSLEGNVSLCFKNEFIFKHGKGDMIKNVREDVVKTFIKYFPAPYGNDPLETIPCR